MLRKEVGTPAFPRGLSTATRSPRQRESEGVWTDGEEGAYRSLSFTGLTADCGSEILKLEVILLLLLRVMATSTYWAPSVC